jgi:hypothetical protein
MLGIQKMPHLNYLSRCGFYRGEQVFASDMSAVPHTALRTTNATTVNQIDGVSLFKDLLNKPFTKYSLSAVCLIIPCHVLLSINANIIAIFAC